MRKEISVIRKDNLWAVPNEPRYRSCISLYTKRKVRHLKPQCPPLKPQVPSQPPKTAAFWRHLACYRLHSELHGDKQLCGFEKDVSMPRPVAAATGHNSWITRERFKSSKPGDGFLPQNRVEKFPCQTPRFGRLRVVPILLCFAISTVLDDFRGSSGALFHGGSWLVAVADRTSRTDWQSRRVAQSFWYEVANFQSCLFKIQV